MHMVLGAATPLPKQRPQFVGEHFLDLHIFLIQKYQDSTDNRLCRNVYHLHHTSKLSMAPVLCRSHFLLRESMSTILYKLFCGLYDRQQCLSFSPGLKTASQTSALQPLSMAAHLLAPRPPEELSHLLALASFEPSGDKCSIPATHHRSWRHFASP